MFKRLCVRTISIVIVGVVTTSIAMVASRAGRDDTCIGQFCYCVNTDLRELIDQRVVYIRSLVAKEKARRKAIGYISIPLTTVEGSGSYQPVNDEVAGEVKRTVEARFGSKDAWLLNPAASDFSLPKGEANGADYMLMWTQVLEGADRLGNDFDFVYFAGPSDFARYFGLSGRADMEKLGEYYDRRKKTDPDLKVDRALFQKYYAFRASVAFSYGSHDEWNIVRAINERRRADKEAGLANQLGVFFDGKAVSPEAFETSITAGKSGKCPK